jgi:hypothetical protein
MTGVEIEEAREIVPVRIEDHLARRHVGVHPFYALAVIVRLGAPRDVFGGPVNVQDEHAAEQHCHDARRDELPDFIATLSRRSSGG